jgi:nicotinate-nucleotide--dimethylbenzimidazole phosphoribosyltransferase
LKPDNAGNHAAQNRPAAPMPQAGQAPAWLSLPIPLPDEKARQAAIDRQNSLTKPPGSLGLLEGLAIRLAALQGSARPVADPVHIAVFAGDHGIAAEGVSAYPQSVTVEMAKNFARGGAAIAVAAKALHASLEIVCLGTACEMPPTPGVKDCKLGPGTANFLHGPAMDETQLAQALDEGRQSVAAAKAKGAKLYIAGEMGIGNTTSASAIAAALLGLPPGRLTGPGTGLGAEAVPHKAQTIAAALAFHEGHLASPLEALRRLGGFEVAAIAGAYLAAAEAGLPALVDGFITTAAALVAVRLRPEALPWLLFSHASAEPGHRILLDALKARPLLDIGMRLGEGSGAAVAVPLLQMACALHNGMHTFAEAGVSGKKA